MATADNLRGLMITGASPWGPVSELKTEVDSPGAWVVRNETVTVDGQVADQLPGWVADCGIERPAVVQAACFDRLGSEGYRQHVTYQPADRYWRRQAYETTLLVAMSLLILGFSFWWLRHHLS